MMSMAMPAREVRRWPATLLRAANHVRSSVISSCRPSSASSATASRNTGSQAVKAQGTSARKNAAPSNGQSTRKMP